MKKCKKCGIEKDYEEFYRNKKLKDGRSGQCKKCRHESQAKSKVCFNCKKEFKTIHNKQKFCSKECSGKSIEKQIEFECANCKKVFTRTPSQVKKSNNIVCSKECQYKIMSTRKDINCKHCDKLFTPNRKNQVYCSNSCSARNRPKKGITLFSKECENCNKEYKTSRKQQKFCSLDCRNKSFEDSVSIECNICKSVFSRNKYQYGRNKVSYCSISCMSFDYSKRLMGAKNPNFIHGKTEELYNSGRKIAGYKKWRNDVIKRDGHQCCVCKNNNDLVAHHLNGYNWFIEGRTDIKNGVTLCVDCHNSFHTIYGRGNNTKEQFEEYINNIKNNIIL